MRTYKRSFQRFFYKSILFALLLVSNFAAIEANSQIKEYPVSKGSHPHDVVPDSDGTVWYTAQNVGELGRLDPSTGRIHTIKLGEGSRPHGVVIGPDRALWITDGGMNAIVRVDPGTERIKLYHLPAGHEGANLNTAVFDRRGILWFTGQSGIYGKLDPKIGRVEVFEAPKGPGPYGITSTPKGDVYFASLSGSYIAHVNSLTNAAQIISPPTSNQGARRIWTDTQGNIWLSEWNVGQLGRFSPDNKNWKEWLLPGRSPKAYAVYVDEMDHVWLSDFGNNSLVRFEPQTNKFESYPLPSVDGQVRQLQGRKGEVWGAESGVDKLVVIKTQ